MIGTGRTARIVLSLAACAGLTLGAVDSAATPPATGTPAAGGPDHTSHAFFAQVLTRLHLPVTAANLDALYAVEHREGDNDRYNPLNVVQPEPGSSAYNSIGVQRYASFGTGVAGTVHLMGNGHWTGVRRALRGGHSTGAVLAAFSDAYTWDSGITFQTERAMLDAEAVRDVGGRFSDPGLAAARARQRQAGLRKAIAAPMADFTSAASTSAGAHRDHDARQGRWSDLQTALRVQRQVAGTAQQAATRDHATVAQMLTAQYLNGTADGSVDHLLSSSSVTEYLDTQALAGYVSAGQQRLFHRYRAEQQRADVAAAVVARTAAAAAAQRRAMTADERTWTAAGARMATARTALLAVLRPAQRDSITQPVAQDALARLR